MSLIITKGYLISRINYGIFDEILILLNKFGNKFICYAQGTRKINSKNARALMFGNYLEFEIFYSETKISKLKKVTILNEIEFESSFNLGLLLMNDLINLKPKTNYWDFDLYQTILIRVLQKFNQYQIWYYALIRFIKSKYKYLDVFCPIHKAPYRNINFENFKLFECKLCNPKIYDKNMSDDECIFFSKTIKTKNINELEDICFDFKNQLIIEKLYEYLKKCFLKYYISVIKKRKKGSSDEKL